MPVTYSIDNARNIIHTRCEGEVTFQEVTDHFAKLISDPTCPPRLNVLLDLTGLTSAPTSEQVRRVSSVIEDSRKHIVFDTCAIAVSSELLYGMMRIFEVFTEKNFRQTRTFRSLDKAREWLNEQVPGG